ncbi:MAG: EI24 domain-containing protein [Proteobacteria bacterium]|nr:EI24 domain-containing protein [Pseudomonadota bacterium]
MTTPTDSPMGVLRAGLLALAQLGDPRLRAPLAKSLGLTLVAFAGLWAGLGWLLAHTRFFETGWLDAGAGTLGGIAAVALSIVLFPSVVAAFLGLFLEEIAATVEARHYPGLPAPRKRSAAAEIASALKLVALAAVLNLIVLPLYLVPGLNLVVFLATNGFLLAREYVTMSAARRVDSRGVRLLWRGRRGQAWLAGAAFAALSTIPIVNLAAPVVAVATTTHLIEAWRRAIEEGPE